MTFQEHKKHADVMRPRIGKFSRTEIGLIGAPCSMIFQWVNDINEHLGGTPKITYVDADHQPGDQLPFARLTDKIAHHRMDFETPINEFDRKILLSSSDLVFVNGNHFESSTQIVFCTQKKKESLQRKLEKLTDVALIILDGDIHEPHDFLKNHLPKFEEIPVLKIDQLEAIIIWMKEWYLNEIPSIKGLVLAGGKSQRMGKNKALLKYHNQPQVYHACEELTAVGIEPYISCRMEQVDQFNDRYNLLHDSFTSLGPFGAILSAFRSYPNSAWLVIACDQPLLDKDSLEFLITHRNTSSIATCYHNPATGFPEPLITLWEPRAYPRLLSFLSMGYTCPRKVLINSDVHELHVEKTDFMENVNTPDERNRILQKLKT